MPEMAESEVAELPRLLSTQRLAELRASMCSGKRRYSCYREAKSHVRPTRSGAGGGGIGRIRAYVCPFCGDQWHHIGHERSGTRYEETVARIRATLNALRLLDAELAEAA